jgi:Endonuclease/Exonuclease/phosphatase family
VKALSIFFLLAVVIAKAEGFKVVTFDGMQLCWGPGCVIKNSPDREQRLYGIGTWLRNLEADVLFLQGISRKKDYQQLKAESAYPYGVYFTPFSDQALLTKFPILESNFFPFRWQASSSEDCKRWAFSGVNGLGLVKVRLPEGEIYFATLHGIPRWRNLPGFGTEADRITPERKANLLEAIQFLWDHVPRNRPLVLAGGFNMNQTSDEYRFFFRNSGLVDSYRLIREVTGGEWDKDCTRCADSPYAQASGGEDVGIMDYLMVSKGSFDVLASKILTEGGEFSDHHAVETKLSLSESSHGFDPPLPSRFDLDSLTSYFREAPLSPVCWLTPGALFQRTRILTWISEIEKFVRE